MKRALLAILVITLCSNSKVSAQAQDTLAKQVLDIRTALTQAGKNMKQYETLQYGGLICNVVGVGCAVYGATQDATTVTNGKSKPNEGRDVFIYGGAGLAVVGIILQIMSHAEIGKAGRTLISLSPGGVTIRPGWY